MSKIAVIGGDLRLSYLAKNLSNDENEIYTYGVKDLIDVNNYNNYFICDKLEDVLKDTEFVISSIPFSKDGKSIYAPFCKEEIILEEVANKLDNKTLFAGSIPNRFYELAKNKDLKIVDLIEDEYLTILNTIATAEGAICQIIQNTTKNLQESKVLVLGFGRVAKTLAIKLDKMGSIVTCAARKEKDFAWIKTLGFRQANINTLQEDLKQYDVIINTVPKLILDENKLKKINKDCLIIDLASKPGGVDEEVCKRENLKFIWALALPGKVSPETSAQFIKEAIYKNLEKEN